MLSLFNYNLIYIKCLKTYDEKISPKKPPPNMNWARSVRFFKKNDSYLYK